MRLTISFNPQARQMYFPDSIPEKPVTIQDADHILNQLVLDHHFCPYGRDQAFSTQTTALLKGGEVEIDATLSNTAWHKLFKNSSREFAHIGVADITGKLNVIFQSALNARLKDQPDAKIQAHAYYIYRAKQILGADHGTSNHIF